MVAKSAKYVLQQSTIQEFVTQQGYAHLPVSMQVLTFGDLKKSDNRDIQVILKDGVKFIKEDANLPETKVLVKNYTACSDVFIIKNAFDTEPVLGWIKDKTISENSIV